MALKLANNAVALLAAAVTTTDTTIALTPGAGAKFPTLTAGGGGRQGRARRGLYLLDLSG